MVPTEEENFPRGGKKVIAPRKRPAYNEDNLFKIEKGPKAKKPKKSKRKDGESVTENVFENSINIQGTLNYKKILDGMVILGCVRHITNFAIEVELPGLTFATVGATNISDPFTKHLNKLLEENNEESDTVLKGLFHIGQFIPVKIIGIEHREKGTHVEGSINPRDINSERNHYAFKKGMLMWGCIQSITDHGYEVSNGVKNCRIFLPAVKIIGIEHREKGTHVEGSINPRDINSERNHYAFKKGMLMWGCIQSITDHGYEVSNGVKNCRIFLPSKNVNTGKKYTIGENLWCAIHKSDNEAVASTLRVSAKSEHVKKVNIEDIEDFSLHDIVPGMPVKFLTEKVTTYGIQGKFEDFFGYIDEYYLKHHFKKPNDYSEGKLVTAYVLFVEPATKITHLTMHSLDAVTEPTQNIGDIVPSEVFSKTHHGIFLKLSSNEKGFVTNKRIIKSVSKGANVDIKEVIQNKFSPGTKHTCRILDYNHMSQFYICTVEQQVVKQKTFSNQDIEIGQLLNVTIQKVKPEGLVVAAGHVKGFVPNLHISNLQYTDNIKKKFKEGVKVNARVFCIENGNILFTLKPNLVDSDLILSDISQAHPGSHFPGVVVSITSNGVLVIFYGNLKGWLDRKEIDSENEGQRSDLSKYFYRGQVMNVKVLSVDGEKIRLTLKEESKIKPKAAKIVVGAKVTAIVEDVSDTGISITLENSKYKGTIPVNQLSASLSLAQAIKNTYTIGDRLTDIICVSNKFPLLFSRRESISRDVIKYKFKRFEALHKGNILRCLFEKETDEGIYVRPLIRNHSDSVLIPKKAGESFPKLLPYQTIIAKITYVDQKQKELSLTVKKEELHIESVETSIGILTQHLIDVKYLREVGLKNKDNLCMYKPGDRVQCTIFKTTKKEGCVVTLQNGIKGLVPAYLCPVNMKEGDVLEGVFLSQNFKEGCAEICLKKDISDRINKTQDGILVSKSLTSCLAEKLLVKEDYIIGLLKQKEYNRQLIYFPLYLNENDYSGCLSYYNSAKLKTCICGKVGENVIGMSKKLFLKLDKEKSKNSEFKSLRNNKETNESLKKKSQLETQMDNEDDATFDDDEDVSVNSGISDYKENTPKSKEVKTEPNKASLVLPGVSTFFNANTCPKNEEESSSSDDEEQEPAVKKKKKLSSAERAELLRQEEERISKIENELADSTKTPESADQFDRLLLAQPNSSELWTKYISFHIAATEIDKARSVAKRALETINMTETTEKFNIWIVLLNLENMFGSKDSFDKVFEDALRYNDSLQIYLRTIQLLAEAGKHTEMEEKVKKVRGKHKQEPQMWLELGKIYYQINKYKEARNLKEAALKSISDKKTQLNIIVRFAIMEFKYGEEDQGSAVFETVLSSDPRKVNIWTTYVDQLIKKGKIEQARRVLERAIGQKLPIKSMKALFLKFRKFEEEYGTKESLEAVKKRAEEYVTSVSRA